jgi:DNA repair protein RadC
MVHRLELRSLKAVERIPRRISPQAGRRYSTRQQQRDQIRRALKQAVEPVICFQTSPSGTTQPSKPFIDSAPELLRLASVLSRIHKRDRRSVAGALLS